MPKSSWSSVSIPEDLAAEIDDLVRRVGLWRSRAEFIRDAVRRQLRLYKGEEVQG